MVKAIGCVKCKQSLGEKYIKECLDRNGLINIQQHRLKDCRNINPLPFDSVIISESGELLCLIEFDGEQHFHPIDAFGGEEGFKERQINDYIKNKYCEENNITLIRIPYWLRDHVDEVLTYWLQYYGIISSPDY